jgi:predicted MPP superfamily phosphohydrolase
METAFGVIIFLFLVNCLPVITQVVLGEWLRYPVDGGALWLDNKPLFGQNKTIRGVVVSVAGGMGACSLLGQPWWIGGVVATFVMMGDLTSSFIKRRLNVPAGSDLFPLDHLFESLLPVLFLVQILSLSWDQFIVIVGSFVLVAYPGTLWWKYIIHRAPIENYPRIIRSTVRLRQWRSCHVPLARYQNWLNLTRILSDQIILTRLFKIFGLYEKGKKNALDVHLIKKDFSFAGLPEEFDGFRILFITDLHLDGLEGLTEKLIDLVKNTEVDLCLLGGDLRMKLYGPIVPSVRELRKVTSHIKAPDGFLGVLGNHDCIEMIPDLEEAGIIMLVNEAWPIERGQGRIWVAGVDDPHYYKLDDARQACRDIPDGAFTIFLAHSPETYKKASLEKADLYLCGHTHGGQVCLSSKRPIVTNSRAPRLTSVGEWRFKEMLGYTSRGVGPSSIPVRFNCPGEVCLITLFQA